MFGPQFRVRITILKIFWKVSLDFPIVAHAEHWVIMLDMPCAFVYNLRQTELAPCLSVLNVIFGSMTNEDSHQRITRVQHAAILEQ